MSRKFTALAAAITLGLTAFAPSVASARDYYRGGYGHHYRHHDDDGDAVAAGVVGLVLGLAVGAAVSQPRTPRYYGPSCYNNCYAPPPPPPCGGCYAPGSYSYQAPPQYYRPQPQPYYQQRYDDRGYDPRYSNSGYGGYDAPGCTRAERQWDRYANRYVTVDVPC